MADVMKIDRIEAARLLLTQLLERYEVGPGSNLTLVTMRRYVKPEEVQRAQMLVWGESLIGPAIDRHFNVWQGKPVDITMVAQAFADLYGGDIYKGHRFDLASRRVVDYVRRAVIPIEWKSADDEWLGDRITVFAGQS
jgi:hypothetical protein